MEKAVFSGLTVVELASVLAGPAVGQFFAELGAEVIKIENPNTGGDITRAWKGKNEDANAKISAYYASVNCYKEILFKDLALEKERNDVYELIKSADILIENFKSGSNLSTAFSSKKVSEINPKLIHARVQGYPAGIQKPAFDVILQAETGFISMCGNTGEFAKMPVALIDLICAHNLKQGILIALWIREKSPRYFLVEANLYEAALSSLANQATNFLMANSVAKPLGTLHPNIAPYGEYFSCSDHKQLILAVGTDKHFQSLCQAIKQPYLAYQEKFSTNPQRVNNRTELAAILETEIKKHPAGYWREKLSEEGVPFGFIKSLDEVLREKAAQNFSIDTQIEGYSVKAMRTAAFQLNEEKRD